MGGQFSQMEIFVVGRGVARTVGFLVCPSYVGTNDKEGSDEGCDECSILGTNDKEGSDEGNSEGCGVGVAQEHVT